MQTAKLYSISSFY